MCPFVQIFVSSVSAKYYLNWFTFGKVITEIKRVNFLLIHCSKILLCYGLPVYCSSQTKAVSGFCCLLPSSPTCFCLTTCTLNYCTNHRKQKTTLGDENINCSSRTASLDCNHFNAAEILLLL